MTERWLSTKREREREMICRKLAAWMIREVGSWKWMQGNNLCSAGGIARPLATIYIRQNFMWDKTQFLAKYHSRQKIIFDRYSCWQKFMLGNNSYFATISLGWGRLSAHRQNLWTFIYCACRQPNNSTATISALNFSKNAIFSVIYKEKDLMWQFELHLTPNDKLLKNKFTKLGRWDS